jgi:hypothetical protein
MFVRIDHQGPRGAERVGMTGTIFGGGGARDRAGEKSQADDYPTRDSDARQTTTDHAAPTRILSIAKNFNVKNSIAINRDD